MNEPRADFSQNRTLRLSQQIFRWGLSPQKKSRNWVFNNGANQCREEGSSDLIWPGKCRLVIKPTSRLRLACENHEEIDRPRHTGLGFAGWKEWCRNPDLNRGP
jgi:hypothetical protein